MTSSQAVINKTLAVMSSTRDRCDDGDDGDDEESIITKLFLFDLDEVLQKIFLHLCPSSLHRSRQVCRQWNAFIVRRVWGCRFGRRQLEARLEQRWRNSQPRETVVSRNTGAHTGDDEGER